VRKLKQAGLGVVAVLAAGYLAICGYLYAEQRHLVFQPSGIPLTDPPAGSGYESLNVVVPKLGTLTDWWVAPTSPALPTIVFFHGNGSDRRDFLAQGESFHRSGWGVVLASYRGYSGNPGSPTETGLMEDARATLATVASRVGPIIVWGHSLGSGIAVRMASEGRAAGVVLEAPYTSLVDVAAAQYPFVPVRWLLLDRFDSRSLIAKIRVPVLIFHSTDDPVIPFRMGRSLADQLGARATLVQMNGLGHVPHTQDLAGTVSDWYARFRASSMRVAAASTASTAPRR
jgi:pimeloyl-ACP methyl ester carboxylesterase